MNVFQIQKKTIDTEIYLNDVKKWMDPGHNKGKKQKRSILIRTILRETIYKETCLKVIKQMNDSRIKRGNNKRSGSLFIEKLFCLSSKQNPYLARLCS